MSASTLRVQPLKMWRGQQDDNPLPRWRLVRDDARAAWAALRDAADDQQLPCASSPDHWYPDESDHEHAAQAVELCHVCPVREECRAFSLANAEPFGIWGGLSERERRTELRRQQRERDKLPRGVAA
jgi:hypothetical protein